MHIFISSKHLPNRAHFKLNFKSLKLKYTKKYYIEWKMAIIILILLISLRLTTAQYGIDLLLKIFL